jgi:hypothetical protein
MGLIAAIGNTWRASRTRGKVIARCDSGHGLKEEDVARGECRTPGCPTNRLFRGKDRVPNTAGRRDR